MLVEVLSEVDLYEPIGFRNSYADVLTGLGHIAQAEGDDERADSLYRQAYDISHQIGYRDGEAAALQALDDRRRAGKEGKAESGDRPPQRGPADGDRLTVSGRARLRHGAAERRDPPDLRTMGDPRGAPARNLVERGQLEHRSREPCPYTRPRHIRYGPCC